MKTFQDFSPYNAL